MYNYQLSNFLIVFFNALIVVFLEVSLMSACVRTHLVSTCLKKEVVDKIRIINIVLV